VDTVFLKRLYVASDSGWRPVAARADSRASLSRAACAVIAIFAVALR
jgi:hypothetical protein